MKERVCLEGSLRQDVKGKDHEEEEGLICWME